MTTKPKKTRNPHPDANARYWNLPAVMTYTGRSSSAIYRDLSFPKPIKLGPKTSVWIAEEVRAWCEQREAEAEASRAAAAAQARALIAARRARSEERQRSAEQRAAEAEAKVAA